MADRPILFLDTGVGSIPYCCHFLKRNPGESVVCLADRVHFPYGMKEKNAVAEILIDLMAQIIRIIDPKIVVIACNTATIAGLDELRKNYPQLPFVGTVPAVKPAVLGSKTGKIGVLGSKLTVNQPYIRDLAVQFGGGEIFGIAAPELIEFVEFRFLSASEEEKRATARGYMDRFRAAGVDALVLGCTHFLFLLEEFRAEAHPDIGMYDSTEGISQRIESLSSTISPSEAAPENTRRRLILTGTEAPEPSWIRWADRLGFSLSLMGEP